MIQIGINENVFLEKVSLDTNNALELVFQEAGKEAKPVSRFANVAGDDVVENTSMGIKLFAPLPSEKKDITEEKRLDLVMGDINKNKGILLHILKGYMTSDELKGVWKDSFAALPIDEDNFDTQIVKKEILAGVHKNMARIFMDHIKPHLGKTDPDHLFRLLLVRQSKDKHYASFRGRYIDDNPFYESMSVPKEQSKVKFTTWEKEQGLDNGVPVAKTAADSKDAGTGTPGAPKADAMTVTNVFGK